MELLTDTDRKPQLGEVKPPAEVPQLVGGNAGPGSLVRLALAKLSPPTRRTLFP